jgi:ABC-type amino acid transport substrate-binding protein
LFIEFSKPELPVDEKASEEVWTMRIDSGRASRVDYFMAVMGMSRNEAEAKVAEIDAYLIVPTPTTN